MVSLTIAAGSDGAFQSWGALLFRGEGVKMDMAGFMINQNLTNGHPGELKRVILLNYIRRSKFYRLQLGYKRQSLIRCNEVDGV